MTNQNQNNNARQSGQNAAGSALSTQGQKGKFNDIVVADLQRPKVLMGTGWLVRTNLLRYKGTIFASPTLEYAGEGSFAPVFLQDDYEDCDEPMNVSRRELLVHKKQKRWEKQQGVIMSKLIKQVSFTEMVGVMTRALNPSDYHLQKTGGGRFALVGIDYPKSLPEWNIVFAGKKGGKFLSVSTDEPMAVVEANYEWLIEAIVGVHDERVVFPIIPGRLSGKSDRLWKSES